jgi:gamma-glutamyl-gamma-aminobutyrate hydrolase PuuD
MFKDTPVYLFGICRGAQLLNVLNGGRMIQECGYRGGKQIDSKGRSVEVCHHQGIISQADNVISESEDGLTYSFYYPETRSYGHQAHPEWCDKTEEIFFSEIDLVMKGN